jgi:hypothetical protein
VQIKELDLDQTRLVSQEQVVLGFVLGLPHGITGTLAGEAIQPEGKKNPGEFQGSFR